VKGAHNQILKSNSNMKFKKEIKKRKSIHAHLGRFHFPGPAPLFPPCGPTGGKICTLTSGPLPLPFSCSLIDGPGIANLSLLVRVFSIPDKPTHSPRPTVSSSSSASLAIGPGPSAPPPYYPRRNPVHGSRWTTQAWWPPWPSPEISGSSLPRQWTSLCADSPSSIKGWPRKPKISRHRLRVRERSGHCRCLSDASLVGPNWEDRELHRHPPRVCVTFRGGEWRDSSGICRRTWWRHRRATCTVGGVRRRPISR
jgi:hypothetical protein